MSSRSSAAPEFNPARVPEERPGPEGGKRHRNRLQRTASLVQGALPQFLERGVDAVTIDDIVTAASMSKGSFYRYFSNKDELVAATFAPLTQAVDEAMVEAGAALAAADDRDALTEAYELLAGRLTRAFLDQPEVVQLYLQERSGPPTPAREPVHALSHRVRDEAIRLTHAARTHGLLRPIDARVSAVAVVGAVHELLLAFLRGDDIGDPAAAARTLVDLVLVGVQHPDGTPPGAAR